MDISVIFTQYPNLILSGIGLGSIYLLMALGYTLVFKISKIINFANSEIFMIGTFISIYINQELFKINLEYKPKVTLAIIPEIIISLLITGLLTGIISLLVSIIAYERILNRGRERINSLIAAIGASIALKEGVRVLTDSTPRAYPKLISDSAIFQSENLTLRLDHIVAPLLSIIIFFIFKEFLDRSITGIKIRAISSNEMESRLHGIKTKKIIRAVFFISGFLAGASSLIYMNIYESTSFSVGFSIGLAGLTVAVLSGLDSIKSIAISSFFIGIYGQFASAIFGSEWKEIAIFFILILILLFRPSGIGRKNNEN